MSITVAALAYLLTVLLAWRMLAGHFAYRLSCRIRGAGAYRQQLERAEGTYARKLAEHILYPPLHPRPTWASRERRAPGDVAPTPTEWAVAFAAALLPALAWPVTLTALKAPLPRVGAEREAFLHRRAVRIREAERELGIGGE